MPSRTCAIRDARRPSVSSVASTTYQRRSISLSRSVIGLRVHRSSCSPFVRRGAPSEDDAPEAQPLGRGGCPVEGRSSGRRAPRRPLSHPSCHGRPPGGRPRSAGPSRAGRRRPGRRSSRAGLSAGPGPHARSGPVTGPSPRRRGSRAGRRRPTRLAPSRRCRAGPAPRARCAREAGCAARSRRCSGTPGTAPHSGGGTRPGPGAGSRIATSAREERIERPSQLRRREPSPVGEGDHLSRGVDPGVGPPGPVDPPLARVGRGVPARPRALPGPSAFRVDLEAGEVRSVVFDPRAVAHGRALSDARSSSSDELDLDDLRRVALTLAEPHDPGVPGRAIGVLRGDLVEQLVDDERLVRELRRPRRAGRRGRRAWRA